MATGTGNLIEVSNDQNVIAASSANVSLDSYASAVLSGSNDNTDAGRNSELVLWSGTDDPF